MTRKYEIMSSQEPYDMAHWCEEKSTNVTKNLSHLIDSINLNVNLPKDEKERLLDYIYNALWDATKLLAFSTGANWHTDDRDIIFNNGYEGYEEIAVRYGILESTKKAEINNSLDSIVNELRTLLDGQRSNRTIIHELLDKSPLKNPMIDSVKTYTESVSLGELSWSEYNILVKALFKDYGY